MECAQGASFGEISTIFGESEFQWNLGLVLIVRLYGSVATEKIYGYRAQYKTIFIIKCHKQTLTILVYKILFSDALRKNIN